MSLLDKWRQNRGERFVTNSFYDVVPRRTQQELDDTRIRAGAPKDTEIIADLRNKGYL